MLLVELPPTRIAISIGIHISSLSMFGSIFPLSIVLSFASVSQLTDSMLHIILEVTFITITISIDIFTFTFSYSIFIFSIILIIVRIDSITSSSIISRVFAFFSSFFGEFVGLSLSLLCHKFQIIINDKFKLKNQFLSKSIITLIFKALVSMLN